MRLKNIPGAREIVDESAFVIADPEQYRGRWREVFQNDHPIELEIGIGKGRFLMDLAARDPETNYLGIEMYSSVLFRAVQKAEQRTTGAEKTIPVTEHDRPGLQEGCNFRLLRFDATQLPTLFAPGEIARIYLNFSDPWPKDRHADRRLTSRRFLERYEKVMSPGSSLVFKTDNAELFTFSLEEIREQGWDLLFSTYDLHEGGGTAEKGGTFVKGETMPESISEEQHRRQQENIQTEYEEKFVAVGKPICMLEARIPVTRVSD